MTKLINHARPALWILFAASLLIALAAVPVQAAYTTGNLLTDPSFENNPLANYVQILGPPNLTNVWGAEMGALSGTAFGVTPASGVVMLGMTDDGGVTTQSFQLVDVSPYSVDINAGLASIDASGLFNVPATIAAAVSSVSVTYMDNTYATLGFDIAGSATLSGGFVDSNASTWQSINIVGAPVPVNTTYMLMQFAYNNASIFDSQGVPGIGFVDDASLTLTAVPEPSSLVLAALAALGALAWRVRR